MSSQAVEIFEITAYVVLIISAVADEVLNSTWNKKYFTTGLPIFVKRIPVIIRHTDIPERSLFQMQFRSGWIASLTFKEINSNTYGFREKLFSFNFHYPPFMHGVLIFDTDNGQVVVKGFMNYFLPLLSLVWLTRALFGGVTWSSESLIGFAFYTFFAVFISGIPYLIQFHRFSRVASFAADAWSRRYLENIVEAEA